MIELARRHCETKAHVILLKSILQLNGRLCLEIESIAYIHLYKYISDGWYNGTILNSETVRFE